MNNDFETTKLEDLKSFPLYVCSKEIIRRYKPFLDPMDLTYTQYLTLVALWDRRRITVKALGECLYLDSGTMTPVLKKLEAKGYITRTRSIEDERSVVIELTERGAALKAEAGNIPSEVNKYIKLTPEEEIMLNQLLYKLLGGLTD